MKTVCALTGLFVSSFLAGCTAVDLDQLVPTAALSFAASDGIPVVTACDPWAVKTDKPAQVVAAAASVKSKLPVELASDAVVNAVINHASYVTAHSTNYAVALTTSAGAIPVAPPAASAPANALSPVDFSRFTQLVVKHIFRRTTLGTSDVAADSNDPFWIKLKQYYLEYFKGHFRSYFGDVYAQPSPSLTINDIEIVQGVSVFIEFLLDEVFQNTVWFDGKLYYPGGNDQKPTYLVVNKLTPSSILASTTGYGCGMNTFKAAQIRYLSSMFSKAAATETGLTIKSAGSVEIGLGIVGKLNIGDNSTLTLLVQAAVSEVVSRLTVQLAVPILSALDFEQNKAAMAGAVSGHLASSRQRPSELTKAETARAMTSLFVPNSHAL